MKVGIYSCTLSGGDTKRKAFANFAEGVNASGDEAFLQTKLAYEECDVAMIFGAVRDKPGKKDMHDLKQEIIDIHKDKGTLLVVDNPVIGRKLTSVNASNPYLRIGWNSFMQDEANFCNEDSPPDRWEIIKKELKIDLEEWKTSGDEIVIMLQKLLDASLGGVEKERPQKHMEWLIEQVLDIRKQTDKRIVIRPHPQSTNEELKYIDKIVTQLTKKSPPISLDRGQTVEMAMGKAWAVVTYTSGSAVDALIAGVPTIACHPGSMAYPICDHDCSNINAPSLTSRVPWIYDLAYTQWHINEFASGAPWKHLRRSLNEL